MNHFVYILKSLKDNGYYIGYTTNIENREHSHNEGLTKSTKNRRPLKIIYYEHLHDKKEAMIREKFLKSSRGYKEKIALIKENDPQSKYHQY